MESDVTPQQALADAERATAALWIDYPPTPAWYYPAGGAWMAGLVVAVGMEGDLARLGAMVVLMGLAVGWMRWYTNYRGTIPRVTSAPAEFRPAILAYAAGGIALLGASAVLFFTVGYLAAAAFTFVAATAGLWIYERAYERAAERTRERLA